MKMKKKEIEFYGKKLLKLKERFLSDVQELDKSSLHETTQNGSGDLSGYGSHLADVATDTYEQEKALEFMNNEEQLLQDVEDALQKIEDNSYGKCEVCGDGIARQRLDAEPYARLCMECKRQEEENKNAKPEPTGIRRSRRRR